MSVELPSFSDYMRVVEEMINKNELTIECITSIITI